MADLIQGGSDASANYNFEDVESGFNYVTYYLHARKTQSGSGTTGASPTTTYHLSKDSTVYSEATVINLSFGTISTCNANVEDETQATQISFDSPTFDVPRTLNGAVIVDFSYAVREDQGAPNEMYFFPSVEVYHYDGSTETQLGSRWYAKKVSATNAGGAQQQRATGYIACGRKKFRKGDILRVKVGGAACNNGGSDTSVDYSEIGIDPLNRAGTIIDPDANDTSTVFTVKVPYEVRDL